jgi:CubicO group peptidase (beta-lactamase class C family)
MRGGKRVTTRRSMLMAGVSLAAGQALSQSGDDWDSASAESVGLGADAVADTLRAGESIPALRALLVARRGKLVAEQYYGGATAASLLPINSATKSVCSALVGLALHEGRLKSLDDTVAQLLPEALAEVPDSAAATVTLRQILTGRTGLAFDPMRYRELESARPLVRHVLGLPAVPAAPAGWSYNDAMVSLIAPILRRAEGLDMADLAARNLFGPMGIERFEWRRDRDGNALAPAGLSLRTRDLLKFAAMMADGGRWQGKRVLPESWVAQSLSDQGPATWRAGPIADVGYGFLWFTGRLHGQRVAWAWGYGGQFSLLAPELGLAVATAATAPPPAELARQTNAVMTLVGRMIAAAA